ncbi:cardiomyopathy-associated protein 5 [Engraulis encrasicolus]|uniref:cardiomyopathy-associated protein 5 n=1 Tax=Engraulis encrasicolus TaxID=184585 RepID=UPI002FD5DF2A
MDTPSKEESDQMEPEIQNLQDEASGTIDVEDEDEFEELHNSLKEVVQDPSVKPKLQCLMVDPSFSMVTVQSEDSGIVWETTSSRCSTPWASEAGSSPSEYSVESSGPTQGKITVIMDEERIVRKRKKSGRSKFGDRHKRPGSRTSGTAYGAERPAMAEVSVPNVRPENETVSELKVDKDEEIFGLISEGYEILNILVPSRLPTVAEEEASDLVDNLSYLLDTPKIKCKSKPPPAPEGYDLIIETEIQETDEEKKQAEAFEALKAKKQGNDDDYLEKFILVDPHAPDEQPSPAEIPGQGDVVLEPEEVKPEEVVKPKPSPPLEESYVVITDDEIETEHFDEVFYANTGEMPEEPEEDEDAHAIKGEPKSLKESGSALFGSQETILMPVYLPEGPPKIIDQCLLEEPRAMSFLYSDLYDEVVTTRRIDDGDQSDAESVVSEKAYKRKFSMAEEEEGYLEKFILIDETQVVNVPPEIIDDVKEGDRIIWPQSKFELTGCLKRANEDEDLKEETKVPQTEEITESEAPQSECKEITGEMEMVTESQESVTEAASATEVKMAPSVEEVEPSKVEVEETAISKETPDIPLNKPEAIVTETEIANHDEATEKPREITESVSELVKEVSEVEKTPAVEQSEPAIKSQDEAEETVISEEKLDVPPEKSDVTVVEPESVKKDEVPETAKELTETESRKDATEVEKTPAVEQSEPAIKSQDEAEETVISEEKLDVPPEKSDVTVVEPESVKKDEVPETAKELTEPTKDTTEMEKSHAVEQSKACEIEAEEKVITEEKPAILLEKSEVIVAEAQIGKPDEVPETPKELIKILSEPVKDDTDVEKTPAVEQAEPIKVEVEEAVIGEEKADVLLKTSEVIVTETEIAKPDEVLETPKELTETVSEPTKVDTEVEKSASVEHTEPSHVEAGEPAISEETPDVSIEKSVIVTETEIEKSDGVPEMPKELIETVSESVISEETPEVPIEMSEPEPIKEQKEVQEVITDTEKSVSIEEPVKVEDVKSVPKDVIEAAEAELPVESSASGIQEEVVESVSQEQVQPESVVEPEKTETNVEEAIKEPAPESVEEIKKATEKPIETEIVVEEKTEEKIEKSETSIEEVDVSQMKTDIICDTGESKTDDEQPIESKEKSYSVTLPLGKMTIDFVIQGVNRDMLAGAVTEVDQRKEKKQRRKEREAKAPIIEVVLGKVPLSPHMIPKKQLTATQPDMPPVVLEIEGEKVPVTQTPEEVTADQKDQKQEVEASPESIVPLTEVYDLEQTIAEVVLEKPVDSVSLAEAEKVESEVTGVSAEKEESKAPAVEDSQIALSAADTVATEAPDKLEATKPDIPVITTEDTVAEITVAVPVAEETAVEYEVEEPKPAAVEEPVVPGKDAVVPVEELVALAQESKAAVEEPAVPVEEPVAAVAEAVTAVEEPKSALEEPAVPVEEPKSAVEEPVLSVEATVEEPVQEPVVSVEETKSAVEEPAVPVEEPLVLAEEPKSAVEEVVAPVEAAVEEPVAAVVEPVQEPVVSVEETKSAVEEPAVPVEEPLVPVEEPKSAVEEVVAPVEAAVEEPVAAVVEAVVAEEEPKLPVEEPVEKPVVIAEETEAVVEEPKTAVEGAEAVAPVEEPKAVVEEPVVPVEEPKAKVEEPVVSVEEPKAEVEEPVVSVEEPKDEVEEPVVPVEEPKAEVEEEAKAPVEAPVEEPVVPAEEPVIPVQEPKVTEEEPKLSVEAAVEEAVEEPTEPAVLVEEPTPTVEEPTQPAAPVEEPTEPAVLVEEPTPAVEEPTQPAAPVEEPTEPASPVEEPETALEEPSDEAEAPVFSPLRSFSPQEDLSVLPEPEHLKDVDRTVAEELGFEMVTQQQTQEDAAPAVEAIPEEKEEDEGLVEEDTSKALEEEEEGLEEPLEGDYEMVEESESILLSEKDQAKMEAVDAFCLECQCPVLMLEEHLNHEMCSLDKAFEVLKERLSNWISTLQERTENIEDMVSEIEMAYNVVEENCKAGEEAMDEQNEEMLKLVMDQYNEMSNAMEDEKKGKLEKLYDQIVSFQESIDDAKDALVTDTRDDDEADPLTYVSISKDINQSLGKALESTMSLELGARGLSVFDDYAKGSNNGQKHRKGIPVPQKPHIQPQEANSATSTSVTVYWTVNEGDIIDCFQVYCMEDPQGAISEEYRVTVKESYCTLEELDPDKSYKVWVMAVNYTGCSLPSERLSFKTAPSVPVLHPEQCTVLWDSATLRWACELPSAAESFTLEYCRQYACEGEGLRSISGIKGFEQSVLLQANENYLFYIKAANAAGSSEQSEAALISTRGSRFHMVKETASPALRLSEDKTTVLYSQDTFDEMSSINECPTILGELLPMKGYYYWETVVSSCPSYRLGVAYDSSPGDGLLGENSSSWCLHCVPAASSCRFELLHDSVETDIFVVEVPGRVGTLLDLSGGRLVFFNAQNGHLLASAQHRFTRPCCAAFGLESPGSLSLPLLLEVPEFARQHC